MGIVKVKNTLADSSPKSYLRIPYGSGGTSLPIKNPNAYAAQWAVQVGDTGGERTEVILLENATPSGTVVNTQSATLYDHPEDTPVYAIKWDKIVFKKSSSGTAGTATAITDGTVTIQVDEEFTQFDDVNLATGDAYKVAYYNSALDVASSDSDWFIPAGHSFYSLSKIRERVRNSLFSDGFIKNDEVIDQWVNEWLEKMDRAAIDVNQDYNIGTVDISHGTDGLATISSNDFRDVRKIWYTTNGSDFYKATKLPLTGFYPNETFNDTFPYYYFQGNSVIGKKPDGTSGTARVTYYKRTPVLDNETDELPFVMRSYTAGFTNYSRAMTYYLDKNTEMGDRFMAFANEDLSDFKREISPRGQSDPLTIDFVEAIDADDLFELM